MPLRLDTLPTDVLLLIFLRCDHLSLSRLSRLCRRFNNIIGRGLLWTSGATVIVTNQTHSDIRNRSLRVLPLKERCRISSNWVQGRFKETVYFAREKSRYMPWLSLTSNMLWLSRGRFILSFGRKQNGLKSQVPSHVLRGHSEDVCRFVVSNGAIISGGRDGALCGWHQDNGEIMFCQQESHAADINAVSIHNSIIVSGSHDETVKVWRYIYGQDYCEPLHTFLVQDRVWSVSCCPQEGICAAGSAGYNRVPPLHIYDLEQGQQLLALPGSYKHGAGVLDMQWECPHTLLSTGYDTYIRLWDIRTGEMVSSWEDPFDSAIYCLTTDRLYTILCGVAYHNRVQLWDKRQHRSIQMYSMRSKHSSPVYSLAFDPCQLFVALDQSLNVMDFSGYNNVAVSYM